MGTISTRQYRVLADHMELYRFLLETYERDCRNGPPAPFFEYAFSSSWMDWSYSHRYRIWLDGDRIVAFCFSEDPVSDVYFNLRPGSEALADEMVQYVLTRMPCIEGRQRLVLFGGQHALKDAARRAGLTHTRTYRELVFDLEKTLDYPLPAGFRFTEPGMADAAKVAECCYKGFDHEAEDGPWDGDISHHEHLMYAPHATPQHAVAIENDTGDYVCFAGMWWTPENALAYLEPFCTVPEYRRRGLGRAALSELIRRMKRLGATHMTGGTDPFYAQIGFEPAIEKTLWERER